jgi:hypothetical protein
MKGNLLHVRAMTKGHGKTKTNRRAWLKRTSRKGLNCGVGCEKLHWGGHKEAYIRI